MGSNTFGNLFKITTWGESHGKVIGVVIDGCPAGLELTELDIQHELDKRRPGKSAYTSPRSEKDAVEILSGLFEGKTTGTPISLIIYNQDVKSSSYEPIKDLLRPGHAHYTYLEKYGIFDYRGGGRASGRETACRVAAGAIAKKFLCHHHQITLFAYIKEIGGIKADEVDFSVPNLREKIESNPLFCPDEKASQTMMEAIKKTQEEGDSLGGIVECVCLNLPTGLGDPIYEKLQASLGKALFSIPAVKGVEIGSGFQCARMKGSEHNDRFIVDEKGQIATSTNHAGGLLGGITTGMPLLFRVAFKPPSSIRKSQETLDLNKEAKTFELPELSRHDPCVAIRGVPVVEAMCALVLADALLMQKSACISSDTTDRIQ